MPTPQETLTQRVLASPAGQSVGNADRALLGLDPLDKPPVNVGGKEVTSITSPRDQIQKDLQFVYDELGKLKSTQPKAEPVKTETAPKTDGGLSDTEKAVFGIKGPEKSAAELSLENGITALDSQLTGLIDEMSAFQTKMNESQKAMVESIKANYAARRRQLQDINKGSLATIQTAGYRMGTERYSPLLATNIVTAEERAGIDRLADLDAEEARLIAEAESAANTKEFSVLSEKVSSIQKLRDQKTQQLKDIQTASREATKQKMDEANFALDFQKTTLDILDKKADALAPGILEYMTGDETYDQNFIETVAKSHNMSPEYLLGKVMGYKNDTDVKLMTEDQKNYRFATQQGYTGSFEQWQKDEANRRRPITNIDTGGFGEYSSTQLKAITAINEKVSKNATYSKTTSMRNYGDNVIVSLGLKTGVGDISAINQFQKVIDEGAVTRDQDVKLIQGAQSLLNTLKLRIKKLEKGDQLSESQRNQMKTLVEKMYSAQVNALKNDPYIASKKSEALKYGITIEDTILGELDGFVKNQSVDTATEKVINGKTYTKVQGGWQLKK